jgi:3-phenylpropionate/cinnamic acid dioxygenase small subunit
LTAVTPVGSARDELVDLYAEYGDALDEDRLDDWLALFVDNCVYRAVARENVVRNLPLATMLCESRAMLADRVAAIRSTSMFIPRQLRHVITAPRLRETLTGASYRVEANFVVLQTLAGDETTLFSTGRYRDVVVTTDDGLRFAEKVAVYDSSLVPTSLIYPL